MADTRLSMSEMEDRAEQISVQHLLDKSLSLSLDLVSGCTRHSSPCHSTSNNTAIYSYPYVSPLFGDVITDPAGTSIIAAGAPAAIASAFSEAHAQGSLDIARYMKL